MAKNSGALNAKQMVLVILVVILIGAGGYGLFGVGTRAWHRRELRGAIPKYLEGLRAQRDKLAEAIEKYHAEFGFYPPNHATGTDRAVVNPLYYELVGTRWLPRSEVFGLPTTKDPVRPEMILSKFGLRTFSNSLVFPDWPTNFMVGAGLTGHGEENVIMVSSPLPDCVDDGFSEDFVAST